MQESKPHPYIAGFSDFYLFLLAAGAILSLLGALLHSTISLWILLALFVVVAITVTLYHKFGASRTLRLTPGELLAGKQVKSSQKVWINPYGVNRWALFFIIFLTFVIIGNSWDRLSEGFIYPLGSVLAKIVMIGLVCYGLVLMGKGKLKGALYPVIYFLFVGFQTWDKLASSIASGRVFVLVGFLFGLAFFHTVIAIVYSYLRRRKLILL